MKKIFVFLSKILKPKRSEYHETLSYRDDPKHIHFSNRIL